MFAHDCLQGTRKFIISMQIMASRDDVNARRGHAVADRQRRGSFGGRMPWPSAPSCAAERKRANN